jgi:hypothetical protein
MLVTLIVFYESVDVAIVETYVAVVVVVVFPSHLVTDDGYVIQNDFPMTGVDAAFHLRRTREG